MQWEPPWWPLSIGQVCLRPKLSSPLSTANCWYSTCLFAMLPIFDMAMPFHFRRTSSSLLHSRAMLLPSLCSKRSLKHCIVKGTAPTAAQLPKFLLVEKAFAAASSHTTPVCEHTPSYTMSPMVDSVKPISFFLTKQRIAIASKFLWVVLLSWCNRNVKRNCGQVHHPLPHVLIYAVCWFDAAQLVCYHHQMLPQITSQLSCFISIKDWPEPDAEANYWLWTKEERRK